MYPADVEKGQPINTAAPGKVTTAAYPELVEPESTAKGRAKSKALTRCLHAIVLTVSIFLLARLFVPHLILLRKLQPVQQQASVPDCTLLEWEFDPEGAAHVSPYEHVAQASTKFPLNSDELFFVSRGSSDLARGSIVISDDGEPGSDVATIDILAYFNSRRYFHKLTKVCELSPGEGRNGVGIFAVQEAEYHRTQFAVHVRLPPPIASPKTTVKNLWSKLPVFWHQVGDLKDTVRFGRLSLSTENTSIYVDSVVADTVSAHSANGLIKGYFNAFQSLDLETNNGPLSALVGLHNDNGPDSTKARLYTTNGTLSANISAFAKTDTGTGGRFDVSINGTNSPVRVIFPHAPADHALTLTAHTDNTPLDLTLHPTFEGNFLVQGARRMVTVQTAAEDPAGRGRQRHVDWAEGPRWPHIGKNASGAVRWLPAEGTQMGTVTASTLVGDVKLRL